MSFISTAACLMLAFSICASVSSYAVRARLCAVHRRVGERRSSVHIHQKVAEARVPALPCLHDFTRNRRRPIAHGAPDKTYTLVASGEEFRESCEAQDIPPHTNVNKSCGTYTAPADPRSYCTARCTRHGCLFTLHIAPLGLGTSLGNFFFGWHPC